MRGGGLDGVRRWWAAGRGGRQGACLTAGPAPRLESFYLPHTRSVRACARAHTHTQQQQQQQPYIKHQ